MLFSRAWGKMIHEKKPEAKKSCDTVPLRPVYGFVLKREEKIEEVDV
jgi:hypothetical protein